MAEPGYHKQILSKTRDLEVKRAGKRHSCAGVAIERGSRPGPLQDVWMWGRSRRCMDTIRQGQLYVANKLLPSRVCAYLSDYGGWLPLCLYCAIETYGEFFEGPLKVQYMTPLSPERRTRIVEGLAAILDDVQGIRSTEAA